MNPKIRAAWLAAFAVLSLVTAGCSSLERRLLFYPSHDRDTHALTPWVKDGELIGYSRPVDTPRHVWLMIHGNGGQASGRGYALGCFPADDSVFILEYPGYGNRPGVPSREAFDRAALEGYLFLRRSYPSLQVGVIGESLGTGPACTLASLGRPPDKLVLIVPFDRLSLVARDHYPAWVVRLLLSNDWDNIAALAGYKGPVEIYGAEEDTVIPVAHAKALAAGVPGSTFTLLEGGHNDWSHTGKVRIQFP